MLVLETRFRSQKRTILTISTLANSRRIFPQHQLFKDAQAGDFALHHPQVVLCPLPTSGGALGRKKRVRRSNCFLATALLGVQDSKYRSTSSQDQSAYDPCKSAHRNCFAHLAGCPGNMRRRTADLKGSTDKFAEEQSRISTSRGLLDAKSGYRATMRKKRTGGQAAYFVGLDCGGR